MIAFLETIFLTANSPVWKWRWVISISRTIKRFTRKLDNNLVDSDIDSTTTDSNTTEDNQKLSKRKKKMKDLNRIKKIDFVFFLIFLLITSAFIAKLHTDMIRQYPKR